MIQVGMAANLRDFVLTNFEGKEVYNGLMQLSFKFSALMPAFVFFPPLKFEKYCLSCLSGTYISIFSFWHIVICVYLLRKFTCRKIKPII